MASWWLQIIIMVSSSRWFPGCAWHNLLERRRGGDQLSSHGARGRGLDNHDNHDNHDRHDKDFVESMVIYTDNGFLERQRPVVLGRGLVSKTLFSFAQNRVGARLQIDIDRLLTLFPVFVDQLKLDMGSDHRS